MSTDGGQTFPSSRFTMNNNLLHSRSSFWKSNEKSSCVCRWWVPHFPSPWAWTTKSPIPSRVERGSRICPCQSHEKAAFNFSSSSSSRRCLVVHRTPYRWLCWQVIPITGAVETGVVSQARHKILNVKFPDFFKFSPTNSPPTIS